MRQTRCLSLDVSKRPRIEMPPGAPRPYFSADATEERRPVSVTVGGAPRVPRSSAPREGARRTAGRRAARARPTTRSASRRDGRGAARRGRGWRGWTRSPTAPPRAAGREEATRREREGGALRGGRRDAVMPKARARSTLRRGGIRVSSFLWKRGGVRFFRDASKENAHARHPPTNVLRRRHDVCFYICTVALRPAQSFLRCS